MALAVSVSPLRDSLIASSERLCCVVTMTGRMPTYLSLTTRKIWDSAQSLGASLPRSSMTRHPQPDRAESTPPSLPPPP